MAGVIVALIVIVVILVILFAVVRRRRTETSQNLRGKFGPEYDRTVKQTGSRRKAEQELQERQERVSSLQLHALSDQQRQSFNDRWRDVQAQFVDDPPTAIGRADGLVQEVMRARGYPVGDFEQRAADVSVDHADVVNHYRTAHEIASRHEQGQANTEDLRNAMVSYRSLFEELLHTAQTTS